MKKLTSEQRDWLIDKIMNNVKTGEFGDIVYADEIEETINQCTNTAEELKPCVACSGKFNPLLKPAYHGSMNGEPTGWWVGCECYNYGKMCDSKEEAIQSWNKE